MPKRITLYRIEGPGEWPLTEIGYILHETDLSDLKEPYLSAVRQSLAGAETKQGTEVVPKPNGKCDYPSCFNNAIDTVWFISFCAKHYEWAMQVLDDAEAAEYDEWKREQSDD